MYDSVPGQAAFQPVFSFLTTAYGTEDTLPRTIEAVRAQSRTDWELIIVDNGFSQAIADAVTPFLSDRRIRLIRQENKGPTGGVMAAAALATGRYLVVLNSDDSVTPDFCAKTGELLAADPGIAAVTCDAHVFTDPGMSLLPSSYLRNAGLRLRPNGNRPLRLADVIDGPCPYYSAPIRRDVWDAMGGMATDTPIVDDLDFWLRAVGAGHDVRMIPDRLGYFRISVGSESRPADPRRTEILEAQLERAYSRAAERSGAPEDIAALERRLRRLRYQQAIRRARVAIESGSVDEAQRQTRRAFSEQRTVRAGAILLGLWAAPAVLMWAHPLKQHAQAGAQRGAKWLRSRGLRRKQTLPL